MRPNQLPKLLVIDKKAENPTEFFKILDGLNVEIICTKTEKKH